MLLSFLVCDAGSEYKIETTAHWKWPDSIQTTSIANSSRTASSDNREEHPPTTSFRRPDQLPPSHSARWASDPQPQSTRGSIRTSDNPHDAIIFRSHDKHQRNYRIGSPKLYRGSIVPPLSLSVCFNSLVYVAVCLIFTLVIWDENRVSGFERI